MVSQLKPAFACLACLLFFQPVFSQEFRTIQKSELEFSGGCFAGTVTVGQATGQSNDTNLPTIFLCYGDSVLIDHNGDQVFMDPDPATPPGIAYALYRCPPTDSLLPNDPCLWLGSIGNGLFATNGPPNGDHWLFNTGGIFNATTFCNGSPCQIYFAPVTLNDAANGMLESGCANPAAAFSVVYLRDIGTPTINNNFGDDCIGRFRLYGGLPEWDLAATYSVDIFLASDPTVKAFIHTPPAQWKHAADVIFYVPKPGIYTVFVEDGISCGTSFQVDMSGCDPSDNLLLLIPDDEKLKGETVCLPVRVKNFTQISAAAFYVSWNPTVLEFKHIQDAQPGVSAYGPMPSSLRVLVDSDLTNPNGVSYPDKSTLLRLCFTVIGEPGSSSMVWFDNSVLPIVLFHPFGEAIAVSVRNGTVTSRCRCPKFKRPRP